MIRFLKKLSVVLITCPLLFLTTGVSANSSTVIEGGQIDKGRTLVPLRAIFEELDANVSWNQKSQTITATKGATKITLKIGSSNTTINGKNKKIDVPASIKDNQTLVPLRFVSEALGAQVQWDNTLNTATITQGMKVIKVHVTNKMSSSWTGTYKHFEKGKGYERSGALIITNEHQNTFDFSLDVGSNDGNDGHYFNGYVEATASYKGNTALVDYTDEYEQSCKLTFVRTNTGVKVQEKNDGCTDFRGANIDFNFTLIKK
ncbi:copper amine oxidase N-terminal domain-containing protein [Cytobacillus sp. FJAT-53684]|uniref:Copper amine oxidase N-terminal domain-containing protein n=1 Tax=Cytobacillus mangrovibacter TaxID=3299024 RepID=A0ABW6K5K8_9BACI